MNSYRSNLFVLGIRKNERSYQLTYILVRATKEQVSVERGVGFLCYHNPPPNEPCFISDRIDHHRPVQLPHHRMAVLTSVAGWAAWA